jgi:hypothetical protein
MSSNDLPQPPAHFDSSERELWGTIVAHMPPGALQPSDAGIMQLLVSESSARRRIEAEMRTADADSLAILKELHAESTERIKQCSAEVMISPHLLNI